MASSALGYVVLIGFAFVFIGISFAVSKKFPSEGVDDFVVAGRGIPFGIISASVMISWVWTTTIMGAAEAGTWYGVSGGFNYMWGAALPFFFFIPLVLHLRKIMPKCTTFTEFIRERFGKTVSTIFFVFGIAVVLYVVTEQGVGIGIVFNSMFHIPYWVGAVIPIMIVALYISRAGLRGSIFNDVIQFFIVCIIFIIAVPIILKTIGLDTIYNGLMDVANNKNNPNYNPEALSMTSVAGLKYGLIAAIVAMGQVLLDQGYYTKAIATTSRKDLMKAYIIGTVLGWAPVPILSGNVFGTSLIALGIGEGNGVSSLSEAAPYIMDMVFGTGIGSLLFALMAFMAGMTTGGNGLAGAQALFTVDFYKRIRPQATEREQLSFGKKIVILIGAVVAVVAVLLEGVSLLKIDIFSGILFAAPTASFFCGLLWKKTSPKVAVISMVAGLAGGLITFFMIEDQNNAQFFGNLVALVLPYIVIFFGSVFSKYEFDFNKLKNYEPAQKVNITLEEE